MSGSPKYSQAYFDPQFDESVRLRLRQRAAAEAARRAREEARRAEARRKQEDIQRQQMEAQRQRMEAQQQRAEARRQQEELRSARAQQAQSMLEDTRRRLATLSGDELVQRWAKPLVEDAMRLLEQGQAALMTWDTSSVEALCAKADASLAALWAHAEERQLQEERRAHLIESLLGALGQQSFLVNEPRLSRADDYDSAVVIQARRTDHREIQIQVPKSCDVSYEIDGYARRLEPTSQGEATTCDDAEAQLAALHTQLAADFGVKMGELRWEGRDPNRLAKGGRPLPAKAQARRERS